MHIKIGQAHILKKNYLTERETEPETPLNCGMLHNICIKIDYW